jgi:hypothetical protein
MQNFAQIRPDLEGVKPKKLLQALARWTRSEHAAIRPALISS